MCAPQRCTHERECGDDEVDEEPDSGDADSDISHVMQASVHAVSKRQTLAEQML